MKPLKSIVFFSILLMAACNNAKHSHSGKNDSSSSDFEQLNGEWQLTYVSGPRIAFEGLYPDDKPQIRFNTADTSVSGNTSCNVFSGKFKAEQQKISFSEDMALTKKYCPGDGETVFLNILHRVNNYSVKGNTLTLLLDGVEMMRFEKK